ncbi:hypothetical protein CGRA01v4_01265 [Colletotrichum graminicola]|nr:hypothetical protein CGRA01v4_01265 [Colletotrichum graminicola]
MLYIPHSNEGYKRRVTRGWVSSLPNDTVDWASLSTGESGLSRVVGVCSNSYERH